MQDLPWSSYAPTASCMKQSPPPPTPLPLAQASTLSTQTAIDYSEIARDLLARPVEDHASGAGD